VELAAPAGGRRLNFLLTDGVAVAATVWGDTLCYRTGPAGVVVASEPHDADSGWTEVPDRSLLLATAEDVTLTPL
jgi:glutamine amidotransferase